MLVIIRGLPGSGKSTIAQEYQKKGFDWYEADMFFSRDGSYRFDPKKLSDAHEWCRKQVDYSLYAGRDCVVSNTFTRHWEMEPYLAIAARYGAPVETVVATGNYRNVHGVPIDAIEKMRSRWED